MPQRQMRTAESAAEIDAAHAVWLANAAQIEIERQRRSVLQDVSSAYAQVISTASQLTAGQSGVSAATVAAWSIASSSRSASGRSPATIQM